MALPDMNILKAFSVPDMQESGTAIVTISWIIYGYTLLYDYYEYCKILLQQPVKECIANN